MIYSNGPAAELTFANAGELAARLADMVPLIRPVVLREGALGAMFTAGRDSRGRFARDYRQVRVVVTGRGHWYRSDDEHDDLHNDTVCRGCGHHGHFDYILDYRPCPKPASGQDVASALLGRSAVAA